MEDNAGWNEGRFVNLLGKLIGEAKQLQNKPPSHVPKENLVGDHVEAVLSPFLKKNGGVLEMERIEYAPGRNNIIVTYPGKGDKYVSFVGSHMDVVCANPEEWDRDPFKMEREGDVLWGRGATDCLGHVAMITNLLCHLAETKPALKVSVVVVFIANEENSEIPDIGVDGLLKHGKIAHLQKGWMYWVDSADCNPCTGTAGSMSWHLTAKGKMGHSGLPHNAINPLILAYESLMVIMKRFHEDFPVHPSEKDYGYVIPSTMKPTMWEHPPGAINQIPGQAKISGDIRLTPFWDHLKVKAAVEGYIADLNSDISKVPAPGPCYKHVVGSDKGKIEFVWNEHFYLGIACDKSSQGFKAINQATKDVFGVSEPYSLTGSLPCVAELKEAGFDLQIIGYGLSKVYHGINEYCSISQMQKGYLVLNKIIQSLDSAL